MPSQVYGPNDHSDASAQLERAYHGRLRFIAFASTGLAWVHVHDLTDGVLSALDRGRVGESYALAGDRHRMREAVEIAARLGGHQPPRLVLPTGLFRLAAPLNDRLGGLPGFPANLRETIDAAENVTYWVNHDKATAELGFKPRSLEQGIVDTWGRA
jgi:dihydroflavonol-4-reductase